MSIELGKQYRINGGKNDGAHVRLYHVDHTFAFGYVIVPGCDLAGIWAAQSGHPLTQLLDRGSLVEVKPKITRTYWLVHFKSAADAFEHEIDARRYAENCARKTVAITGPHTVEYTEGEGLS